MESPSLENDDIQGNNVEKCTKSQHVGSSPMEMLNEHLNTNLLNFHINDNDDCDIQFFQHAGSISRQSQSQTDQFSTAVDDQRIKHNDMEMRKSCINVNLSQAFSNSGNFFAPFSFPDNGMDFDEPQFFPGNCVGYLETILEETDEEIDDEEGCSGINWWMANSDTDTDSVICLDNANQLKSPRGNFTTAELSKEYLPFLDPDRERILYGLHSQSSTQVFHQLESINASVSDPVNLTSTGNSLTDHVNVNCPSERNKQQERADRSKEEAFELFNAHFYPADVRTINNESTSSSLFESNSKDDDDPSCFEENGDLHSAENINEEFNYTSSDNDSEDDSEETSSDDSKTDGVVLAEFSLSSSFPVNNRFRNSVGDKSKSGLRSFRSFDSLNSLTGYDILVPKLNTSLTNSCCADSAFLRHDEEDLADFKMNEDLMFENKTPAPPPHGGTKNLTKQMSSEDLSEDSGIGVEGAKSSAFLQSSNLLFSNPNNVQNHDDSKVNCHSSSSTVPVPLADFALNPFVYSSASASEESSRNSSLYYAYDVRLQDESSSERHHDHEVHRVHANNPFFTDIMDDEVKRKTDEALRNNTPLLPPTLSIKSNSPDREITDLTDSFGSQEILSDNLSDSELTPTPYLESPSQNDSMNDLNHEADEVEDGSSPDEFLRSSTGDEKPKVDSESMSDDKVVIVGTQKKIAEKAKSLTNLSNLATLRLSSADNDAENIEDDQTNSKKSSFIDSDLSDTDERARSLEFLLDQESSSTNTQNNLRKNSLPAVSEHELRIQRSLRKLNVPEWFTKHSYSTSTMSESFRNKVVSPGAKRLDVSYKNDGGRDWKTFSSSKTPSLSSLHGSGRFKHRSLTSYVPFNHDATSPTATEAPSPLKPADPSRPTYVKKPYLGWRSQEKLDNILPSSFVRSGSSSSSSNFRMSVYRPPAERLAAEALATSAVSGRVVSESPKVEYISKSKNTQSSNLDTTNHQQKFSDTQTDNLQTKTSASHPFQLSIRRRLDLDMCGANSSLLKESELGRVPGTRHQLWIESSFLG